MAGLGLLVLVFLVVPGYVADKCYAACWGLEKPTDAERLLRSLIWSVFGLGFFLSIVGTTPVYLPSGATDLAGAAFTRATLLHLALHTAFACAVTLLVGWLLSNRRVEKAFALVFRRSIRYTRAWDAVWHQHRDQRQLRVVLDNGTIYWGHLLAVSQGTEDKDLVLHGFAQTDEDDTAIDDSSKFKILYLPASRLREIRFTKTPAEVTADAQQERRQHQ